MQKQKRHKYRSQIRRKRHNNSPPHRKNLTSITQVTGVFENSHQYNTLHNSTSKLPILTPQEINNCRFSINLNLSTHGIARNEIILNIFRHTEYKADQK